MLVSAVDRAVDAVPFVVTITLQRFEQRDPLASFGPSVESIEHGFPRSEIVRQVTPWHSSTTPPQHRFDEVPVVLRRASASFSLRDEQRFNLLPLPLVQLT